MRNCRLALGCIVFWCDCQWLVHFGCDVDLGRFDSVFPKPAFNAEGELIQAPDFRYPTNGSSCIWQRRAHAPMTLNLPEAPVSGISQCLYPPRRILDHCEECSGTCRRRHGPSPKSWLAHGLHQGHVAARVTSWVTFSVLGNHHQRLKAGNSPTSRAIWAYCSFGHSLPCSPTALRRLLTKHPARIATFCHGGKRAADDYCPSARILPGSCAPPRISRSGHAMTTETRDTSRR